MNFVKLRETVNPDTVKNSTPNNLNEVNHQIEQHCVVPRKKQVEQDRIVSRKKFRINVG